MNQSSSKTGRITNLVSEFILRYLRFRQKKQQKKIDVNKPLALVQEYEAKYAFNDQAVEDLSREILGFDQHLNIDNSYISSLAYKNFKEEISKKANVFAGLPFQLGALDLEIDLCVSILSKIKDPNVLEIGVANGYSSAFLYDVLSQNGGTITSIDLPRFHKPSRSLNQFLLSWLARHGKLPTTGTLIDLHPGGVIPADRYGGWLVPIKYRTVTNTTLTGNVFSILDEQDLTGYDFVLIDAMKDYNARIKLMNLVLTKMNPGAIGILDGYWANNAFLDFCNQNKLSSWQVGRLGLFKAN